MKTNDDDFAVFCIMDSMKEVGKGLLIYAVALGAFWLTIG